MQPYKNILSSVPGRLTIQKQSLCEAQNSTLMQKHKPLERRCLAGLCSPNQLAKQVRLEHESVK
jgi:hypothetical protein